MSWFTMSPKQENVNSARVQVSVIRCLVLAMGRTPSKAGPKVNNGRPFSCRLSGLLMRVVKRCR